MAAAGVTRILGVDPGSQVAGIAVVERDGARTRACMAEAVRLGRGGEPGPRLAKLYDRLQAVIATYAPGELAVESVFVARNVNSALKLGQARGVVLLAAAQAGLAVFEYAPRAIKLATVGSGRAEKAQVRFMMQQLFALNEPPPADAADALAVALYHAHQQPVAALTRRATTATAAQAVGETPARSGRRRSRRWVTVPEQG
ncbi:MAG: crossover junction endodeoxyribonuclease RuvC [Thioalkalivibrionaceae bacterium]